MSIWRPEREIELAPVPPPQTSEIYPESYWECDRGHKFWRGEIRQRNPSICPVCDSKMVKWVPVGPQF